MILSVDFLNSQEYWLLFIIVCKRKRHAHFYIEEMDFPGIQ